MNNELKHALYYAWQKKWIRIIVIVTPIVLIGAFIISVLLQPPKLATKSTNLTVDSYPQIVGDDIAAYNGTSFFTVNPTKNEVAKVVYTPKYRLPEVSTVIWASKHGVLLNFKSGIMYTPVQDYLLSNGISQTIDEYATWYLSFTDGSLKLVDENNLQNEAAIYSQKDNGIYYVPNIKYSDIDVNKNTLRFYSLETYSTQTVVEDLSLTVDEMTECDVREASLCIIGRESSETFGTTSIYAIAKSGSRETIVSQKGEIYPTPIKNTYALLGDGETYLEIESIYSSIELKNIATNASVKYSGKVFGGNVVVGMLGKDPYILDGKNNEYLALRRGSLFDSTQVGELETAKAPALSDGITIVNSKASEAVALVSSLSSEVHVVSIGSQPQQFTKNDESSVKAAVNSCATQAGASSGLTDSTFTVYVNDDDSFNSSLATFKECVSTPENMYGYTYTYKGVSPINGRISTD